MHLGFAPLRAIEGNISRKNSRICIHVNEIGCRVVQVYQQVLALTSSLYETLTKLLNGLIGRTAIMLHLVMLEVEINEEPFVLEKRVDLVCLIPDK